MLYNKEEIKNSLTTDDIFEILLDFGGDPELTDFGIISETICHNPRGVGSRKLYFYEVNKMFHCYSGCADPSFDIFELVIKVMDIQYHQTFDLNQAVRYIAFKFGMSGEVADRDENELEDWEKLDNYEDLLGLTITNDVVQLKEYDDNILDKFNYKVKIKPWLEDGISQEAIEYGHIGYFPGNLQITIPHYDKDGRFIGLRGRTLSKEDAELYGKYRPMRINKVLYSHPLGMNLYNLNNSKNNIKTIGKAIVFESEKSCLQYVTKFGIENDISVACCGSNLSTQQLKLLTDAGAKEIIIAFDRQFQKIGDDEYNGWVAKLKKLNKKYRNLALISIMFDKHMITPYKASPTDCSKEKFTKLYEERIIM